MIKPRPPKTFEFAIATVIDGLGVGHIAEFLGGVATSTIHGWGNQDSAGRPTVHQAVLMDLAYARQHKGYAPILAAYMRKIKEGVGAVPQSAGQVAEELLDVPVAVGRLVEVVKRAKNPDSPGGRSLTSRETVEILQSIQAARRELDELEIAVKQERDAKGER